MKTLYKYRLPRRKVEQVRQVVFLLGLILGLSVVICMVGGCQIYVCKSAHPRSTWAQCLSGKGR